jgi:hypothetical protein
VRPEPRVVLHIQQPQTNQQIALKNNSDIISLEAKRDGTRANSDARCGMIATRKTTHRVEIKPL